MTETTTATAMEAGGVAAFSDALAAAVERAATATVTVNARRRSSATGIAIGDGMFVTADHVIEREEEITIGLPNGSTVSAKLAGRDPGTDLAVLRADGANVPAAEPASSMRVGNIVLAVGRPGTGGPVASLGIISALGGPVRTGRGGQIDQYIRTDAIYYPGFSGGPLVNVQGQVLGLNTSALSRGSGLALPFAMVKQVAASLAAHGKIRRGFLGISSQPVKLPEAQSARLQGQSTGLLIVGAESGGPADKGGVLVGDILVSLAGEPVRETDDLQRLLTGDRVGNATPVGVLRGGEPREISIVIGERS